IDGTGGTRELEYCVSRSDAWNPLNVFLQAEDGIRDATVTGVQTCALPILLNEVLTLVEETEFGIALPAALRVVGRSMTGVKASRSEERRVGKEGRSGWRTGC